MLSFLSSLDGDPPDLHSFLHDALPISHGRPAEPRATCTVNLRQRLLPRWAPWPCVDCWPSVTRIAACCSTKTARPACAWMRSEEHTSELQSRRDLVCRLLLEKKNIKFC